LKSLEEDEQKHREKIMRIEEKKLALKHEKMQLHNHHRYPWMEISASLAYHIEGGMAFNILTSLIHREESNSSQMPSNKMNIHQLSNTNVD
jgi:hypothetical protein